MNCIVLAPGSVLAAASLGLHTALGAQDILAHRGELSGGQQAAATGALLHGRG